jgi:restriction endonuclease S subunit
MTHVDSFLHDGETVCIGRKGTIDKPIYYKGKIWTVDTLFYTHSFEHVLPKFVFYTFQSINWLEHNEASGVPSLSKRTIEKILFKAPTVEEQVPIVTILDALNKKIELEQSLLSRYEHQKQFLLQNLFI